MRVALCISGDFRPDSNVIAAAAEHILPTENIDVFASFWTTPDVGEAQLRAWMKAQMNVRTTLRRWTFAPIRPIEGWEKFIVKSQHANAIQEVARVEYALQQVSQLKAEQERLDGRDYDAVVRLETDINIAFVSPLSDFLSLLDDHVIMGCSGIMPDWPVYDFRVMMMSSRSMEICAALNTLHRRQYVFRTNTVRKVENVMVEHLHYAQLKVLSVPVNYKRC